MLRYTQPRLGGDMTISRDDISAAIRYCSAFQSHYTGPNPLSSGLNIEDPDTRDQLVEETWVTWASFSRTYFMGMLNIIGGMKPLLLKSEIQKFCTPAEALGGNAATEVFWRRDLAHRAPLAWRGPHALNAIQLAILADDAVNTEVFRAVEKTMEAEIMRILRSRRNFLRGLDPDTDHVTGLETDIAWFFSGGRPTRLMAKDRNKNYDGMLF